MSVYGAVETVLRDRRDSGGKALVPYITGGLGDDWVATVQAVAAVGADVIEIGIPFSDPVMDGPTIQAANERALLAGATPTSILDALRGVDVGVPLIAMTYYNIAFRAGLERFAAGLVDAGVSAVATDPRCTIEDRTLFSHRRGAPTGRLASVIWMDTEPA